MSTHQVKRSQETSKKRFSLTLPPLFRRTIDYETGETISEEMEAFDVDGQSLYVPKSNQVLIDHYRNRLQAKDEDEDENNSEPPHRPSSLFSISRASIIIDDSSYTLNSPESVVHDDEVSEVEDDEDRPARSLPIATSSTRQYGFTSATQVHTNAGSTSGSCGRGSSIFETRQSDALAVPRSISSWARQVHEGARRAGSSRPMVHRSGNIDVKRKRIRKALAPYASDVVRPLSAGFKKTNPPSTGS